MGLLEKLRDVVVSKANETLVNAQNAACEEIGNNIKEKTMEATTNGLKNYLNDAKAKVDNEEGREAIDKLETIVDDTSNLIRTASDFDSSENEMYMEKTKKDLNDLAKYADNYDDNEK